MMNDKLTLGSLFDGSGGFPLAGLLSGIGPVWASEIEPFCIRVTMKRIPFMKHFGDVSSLCGKDLEPVDIITFGSPCQDMSIAGSRKGLEASRSGLFFDAIRIIKEMREATDGRYPRYIVWENVPGAFSSNKGEDFHQVLKEIVGIKGCEADIPRPAKWEHAGLILAEDLSIAWRLLDAAGWGVPQRRKRIYLVADLTGQRAGKILFESEGLSGYSAESFRTWQKAAGCITESTGETGRMCLNDQGGNRMDITEDVTSTLRAEAHHPPVVMQCFGICGKASNSMMSDNPNSGFYEADTARTIDGNGGNPTCNQGGIAVVEGNGSRPSHYGKGFSESDVMYTLNATEHHAVAFADKSSPLSAMDGPKGPSSQMLSNPEENFIAEPKTLKIRCGKEGGGKGALIQNNKSATLSTNNDQTLFEPTWSTSKNSHHTEAAEEMANTLVATDYKDPPLINAADGIDYIVRRLTPTECARLQGFPDWWCSDLGTEEPTADEIVLWTDVFETHRKIVTHASKPKTEAQIIKWLKDPHTDSAEYKMWGNGIALPNAVFVLAGIAWADRL